MSYVRFGWDGSDVYVFTSSAGIECCGCALQVREWVDKPETVLGGWFAPVGDIIEHVFRSNDLMADHLRLHEAAGHHVPAYVFEELADPADAAENAAVWAEYDAAHS